MKQIWQRLRDEPVLILAVLAAATDALVSGVEWRQGVALVVAAIARQFVTPARA